MYPSEGLASDSIKLAYYEHNMTFQIKGSPFEGLKITSELFCECHVVTPCRININDECASIRGMVSSMNGQLSPMHRYSMSRRRCCCTSCSFSMYRRTSSQHRGSYRPSSLLTSALRPRSCWCLLRLSCYASVLACEAEWTAFFVLLRVSRYASVLALFPLLH